MAFESPKTYHMTIGFTAPFFGVKYPCERPFQFRVVGIVPDNFDFNVVARVESRK